MSSACLPHGRHKNVNKLPVKRIPNEELERNGIAMRNNMKEIEVRTGKK